MRARSRRASCGRRSSTSSWSSCSTWGRNGEVAYVTAMQTQVIAARTVAEELADAGRGLGADRADPGGRRAAPGADWPTWRGSWSAHNGESLEVVETNEFFPEGDLYDSGAALPGPDAKLAGPTFEEWLKGSSRATSSNRSASSAIARPSSPRASRPPRASWAPERRVGQRQGAGLVVRRAVQDHDRLGPDARDALRAHPCQRGLHRLGGDEHGAVGHGGGRSAQRGRAGVDHERREVAGGVGKRERVGAADQAQPTHRPRAGARHVLERAREARGGVRGERNARRPRLAAHRRRARRVAHWRARRRAPARRRSRRNRARARRRR